MTNEYLNPKMEWFAEHEKINRTNDPTWVKPEKDGVLPPLTPNENSQDKLRQDGKSE